MESDEQEIQALLRLIDDPDQEVYSTVANKILGYGSGIIPRLESLWEITPDESVQERLEMLIHRVHFHILKDAFIAWNKETKPDLLSGALLIARYQFPDLQQEEILLRIKKLERNIWLELNNYLTALEKINVLNSIFYNHFHIKSVEMSETLPKHYFINHLTESHEGNAVSVGILYQILCKRLDIPVYAIGLPRQFILGYFDLLPRPTQLFKKKEAPSILFYIDPTKGQIYSSNDVNVYLNKLMIPKKSQYFQPQSIKGIIKLALKELSLCYKKEETNYKYEELRELADILG